MLFPFCETTPYHHGSNYALNCSSEYSKRLVSGNIAYTERDIGLAVFSGAILHLFGAIMLSLKAMNGPKGGYNVYA